MNEKILKEYFPLISSGRQTNEAISALSNHSGAELSKILWQRAGIMAMPEVLKEIQERFKT